MIQLIRIDDRLLHGMTGVTWCGALHPDVILIANDEAFNDALMASTLKLAKPAGVALVVASIQLAKEKLQTPKYKNAKVFIITDSLEDAYEICRDFPTDIKGVNFGMNDVKKRSDLVTIVAQIFMTKSDLELAQKIDEIGINFFVQAIPTSQKLSFNDVKKKFTN